MVGDLNNNQTTNNIRRGPWVGSRMRVPLGRPGQEAVRRGIGEGLGGTYTVLWCAFGLDFLGMLWGRPARMRSQPWRP